MHASVEQLLSIRDGEPVTADIATHIKTCPRCQMELDRLVQLRIQLRALPVAEAPQHLWAGIHGNAPHPRAPYRGNRWLGGLAAAVMMSALAGYLYLIQTPRILPRPLNAVVQTSNLVQQSQRLEVELKRLRERESVLSAGTAGTIANLEDQVGLIDYQLNKPNQSTDSGRAIRDLWQQRVDLMRALVTVRYAQTAAHQL